MEIGESLRDIAHDGFGKIRIQISSIDDAGGDWGCFVVGHDVFFFCKVGSTQSFVKSARHSDTARTRHATSLSK